MNKELGRSAVEFNRNLHDIQARIEDEVKAYDEMPHERKRKCLDTLEETMQTLQKIKQDLTRAEDHTPDTHEVQIILKSGKSKIADFTKEDLIAGFHAANHRNRGSYVIPIPNILTVTLEDNFQLDDNKYLQPARMCFVRFSSEEEVSMVLGFEELQISHQTTDSVRVSHHIRFIPPVQIPEVRKIFRHIGTLLTRLDIINQELKKIGAIREHGMIPKLGPEFCDRQTYRGYLAKFKAQRTIGASLDHHSYAPLASMRPVDTTTLNASIKALYDEECDILIQLREFQLSRVEFEFKTHATRH
jgi:hypothetical protein